MIGFDPLHCLFDSQDKNFKLIKLCSLLTVFCMDLIEQCSKIYFCLADLKLLYSGEIRKL